MSDPSIDKLKMKLSTTKHGVATLSTKIQRLRQSRSADPIQQLQSEVIIDLYELIRQHHNIEDELLGALLPKTDKVRDAAEKSAASAANAKLLAAKMPFPKFG